MTHGNEKRFHDFFVENKYIVLKNYLYNYILRKRAIEKALARETCTLILETGSGISPVMTRTGRIVYSDLSFLACRTLKHRLGRGYFVCADAARLPFRDGAFSHTLSSEVLEHVEHDAAAIAELARVMQPGGRALVTFPHRKAYYTNDDRFVGHFRRYERDEMETRLRTAGLEPAAVQKILGPLEKLTMMGAIFCVEMLGQGRGRAASGASPSWIVRYAVAPVFRWANLLFACVAWLDARLAPSRFAAVLLIIAEKGG